MHIPQAMGFVAVLSLGVVGINAHACQCKRVNGVLAPCPPPTVQFTGRVVSLHRATNPERVDACFDTTASGDSGVPNPVCVWTSDSSHSCGYPFQLGHAYVVRAMYDPDEIPAVPLNTDVCLGTYDVETETDPMLSLTERVQGTVVIVTGAVVAVAAILVVVRMRGRRSRSR